MPFSRHNSTRCAQKLSGVFGVVMLLCSPSLTFSHALASDKYTLDLTDPAIIRSELQAERECHTHTGGGVGTSAPRTEISLKLEIISLEPSLWRVGDSSTVQLRLTNVGNRPVRIPWSWDKRAIYTNYCSAVLKSSSAPHLEASSKLLFVDEHGKMGLTSLHALYGTLDEDATYRLLAPGESARIKFLAFPGQIFVLTGPPGSAFGFPQEFLMSAEYELRDSSLGNPYDEVRSTSSVRIRIEKSTPHGNALRWPRNRSMKRTRRSPSPGARDEYAPRCLEQLRLPVCLEPQKAVW